MRARTVAAIAAIVMGIISLPFLFVLNYLEPHQRAITWDVFGGEMALQDHPGWHARKPWVMVTTIDIRPARVCITSSARAALNCKLVRFVPDHYEEFIEVQGFGFYWWSNRLSFNSGYREEYRGMNDLLRGYAFSAKQYSFIEVLEEYE